MNSWISDLLIFLAGLSGGVLICLLAPLLFPGKERRTKMLQVRRRVLADIKQKHDEEILDEALQTTEAIRSELERSRVRLEQIMATVTEPDRPTTHPLNTNQTVRAAHANGQPHST